MDALERLRRLVEATATDGTHVTSLPRVSVVAESTAEEPTGDRSEPALALVVQGAKRTVLGDRAFSYAAGQYVVAASAVPVTGTIVQASPSRPFLAFVLHVDPAAVVELLMQSAAEVDGEPLGCEIGVSDAPVGLLDVAARMLELLTRPRDAAVLGPLYERELLWHLLTGEQGAIVRQIGLADGRVTRVARALGWIRSHYAEPLRVADLARLSSMSPRTLHRSFRDATGMTPLQYQKRMRLHEARARLATGTEEIARVGYDVGYESPSQFSREYRRMFGTSPRRDVTRTESQA